MSAAGESTAASDKRQSSEIRFLDKRELEELVAAIDIDKEPFGALDRAIVLTAGCNRGELLALRRLDVDWKAKRIRVRRNYVRGYMGTPKSRSGERSVPLSTLEAAGVRHVRLHDLRHTFATRMAASPDVAMRQIQEWMGHRTIGRC